jgi:hypothetical protein
MEEESNVSSRRGTSRRSRDWTQGSILKNILSLSWPMMVSNTLNVLGPTVDMIWLGKLGPDSMAAVGVAGMVVMLVNAFLMGIFTGLRSMVARFIGADDSQGAVHVAQQAFNCRHFGRLFCHDRHLAGPLVAGTNGCFLNCFGDRRRLHADQLHWYDRHVNAFHHGRHHAGLR